MNVSLQMLRRRVVPPLFLLLLLFPCSGKPGQTSPESSAPKDPLADVNFSQGLYNPIIQKIVERVVNEQYYSGRPDPRVRIGKQQPPSEEEKQCILKLVALLGDDNWEVRQKAHRQLETFCPMADPLLKKCLEKESDLETRRRLEQILARFPYLPPDASAEELLKMARSHREDDNIVFFCYWEAARKMPSLANDTWLRDRAQTAYYATKNKPPKKTLDDTALYILNEFEELAKRFPDSPFIEDVLFRLGEYEALYRLYPHGKYRPYALYSYICGHWYFDHYNWGGLEIRDGKREIEMWPEFLAEFPDHPGANDAWYRYGRALEEDGRHIEAIRALVKARNFLEKPLPGIRKNEAWPDDTRNMQDNARRRIYYIMDALMSPDELTQLAKEMSDDIEIVQQCGFTYALRLLRAGHFAEARNLFAEIVNQGIADKGKKPSEIGNILACAARRTCWLDSEILPHWNAYLNDPASKDADLHLYNAGQAFYSTEDACHNEAFQSESYMWEWSDTIHNKQYWLECRNYPAAIRIFSRLLEMHPESGLKDKVLYQAARSCQELLDVYPTDNIARESKIEYHRMAVFYCDLLISECSESSLVADAKTCKRDSERVLKDLLQREKEESE